ncbi:MAG: GlsB/YeaQ/YmgE family stress response membrane protein [Propionibacteriaceae bacterium]|nr:GlsB/YeaQ/YmgE family stress response membrane protein [Propionibacteriaceae bacterium]
MGTIIAYIVIGLLGGAIAKAIMPGTQGGGWVATILLGIVGALLGGFLGGALFGVNYNDIFSLQGLLFSVLGALLILAIWGFLARRRA